LFFGSRVWEVVDLLHITDKHNRLVADAIRTPAP